MSSPEVSLFLGVGQGLRLGKTERPVQFTTQAQPLEPGHYQIWEWEYPGDETANGCFFVLPPHTKTKAGLIIEPATTVNLEVTHGSGVCPKARFLNDAVDAQRPKSELITLNVGTKLRFRAGDIYRLVAGPDGLIVKDVTTPPFRPDVTEETLDEGDPRAPFNFWWA